MLFVIKLHPEILIKSRSARSRINRILERNLRSLCKSAGLSIVVSGRWDCIEVELRQPLQQSTLIELLQRVPGVDHIEHVAQFEFHSLDALIERVCADWQAQVQGQRFAVRVKRQGDLGMTSTQLAAQIGSALLAQAPEAKVDLRDPEIEVPVQIKQGQVTCIQARWPGLGGLPIPTQGQALALMSGGFDSAVAAFQLIRRGVKLHYLFFNLGGEAHSLGVRQLSQHLWRRYGASAKVHFIEVNFSPVIAALHHHVEDALMGVVLKRLMLKTAATVADKLNIPALVTGESLGQVASQTLSNLQLIDQATDKLVLRPLIASDKESIIQQARQIGTEPFSRLISEYCAAVSIKPTLAASAADVKNAEARMPADLIDQALASAKVEDIRKLELTQAKVAEEFVICASLPANAVVLDIRAPAEVAEQPLQLELHPVQAIPFYQLMDKFAKLPQHQTHFLYCQQGMLSRLQAKLLWQQGFRNLGVYSPH